MYITNRNEIFDQSIINDAIEHAKEDWPNEACGAIINDKYERFENKAHLRGENKSDSFLIKDNDFNLAYINNEVQCVIHSHNDYNKASKQDQIQQTEMEIPFGIINLKNKSVIHVVFWGDNIRIEPLKGRQFFYGVWDCLGIVRDYYRLNYNIISPNPARDFAFWFKGVSMFEEYTKENMMPFNYVEVDNAQPGDVLFYNIHGTKYVNHCAIYLKQDLVLHHLDHEISKTYPMTYYRQFLMKVMRFNPNWNGYGSNEHWSKK